MKNQKPIILVDGSSYLYRAFFATPQLTNAKGEPTGAIYGVINMIRSLLNQYEPTHVAIIFDAKGGSFRKELYSEYKATREAMPEDLRVQVEPTHEILKAMGLPVLTIDGVEADDVIGTLAKQAEKKRMPILVSTGDKDMAQLVSKNITLINTMTGTELTPDKVVEKFGVPAEKIIDYLALMGDSSDNIPGVNGVGEKTAQSLLQHFSGIDDIYARINEVPLLAIRGAKSVQQKLIDNEDNARLSYVLATIKLDVELDFTPEQLIRTPYDFEKLSQFFAQQGFNRWLNDLNNHAFLKSNYNKEHKNQAIEKTNANDEFELTLVSMDKTDNTQQATKETEVSVEKQQEKNYETIFTKEQLDKWVKKLKASKLIAFDTETNSLDHISAQMVGLSFCVTANEACYIPLHHYYTDVPKQLAIEDVLDALKPIFEDENIKKIGQNVKFDYCILANYDIFIKGITFDTMLESYVLNSSDHHDMDSLAIKYLNHKTTSFKELTGFDKKLTIDMIDINLVSQYACEDADITFQLHEVLWPKVEKQPHLKALFTDIELPLAIILAQIEREGVLVNEHILHKISKEFNAELNGLEDQIHQEAGETFNIASPKQLQTILFEKNGLPVIKRTPKGEPSTNEEVLSQMAETYLLPKLILEYRGLAKLINTYTDKLPKMISEKDHRIHTNFNQIGTITGRLSSSDPNLQNIPVRNENGRKIRQAFVAPKGYKIISADYSQIELRIMAHLSKDKNLSLAFTENKDIHRFTAAEILGKKEQDVTPEERRNAKVTNFGLIYGISVYGLAKQINLSRKEAQDYMDGYFNRYPRVLTYMTDIKQIASEQGYVETVSGRRLYLPRINSSNGIERRGAERAAINAPMQGTAADIIKTAMIEVNKYIADKGNKIKMVLQVHDELLFEVPEQDIETVSQDIKSIMENCYKLNVPLKVDIGVGNNWDEAH